MFKFKNLDPKTRSCMLQAIDEAEQSDNIYYSERFNDAGKKQWVSLLKEAVSAHNEHWLASQLEAKQLMTAQESARKSSGGYSIRNVPYTAAETMAEGQFNRFYILGLCKRAREEGISDLAVYRAQDRRQPRAESEDLIDTEIPIDEVEAQLKERTASLKSPLIQPNSGISMCLP